MYLYFDRNGTLKEQITVSPPRVGDINVNKIYVFWEDHSPVNGYCVFRKPDGTNTTSIPVDEFVNEIIPYDQERDLYFFHYNTTYRFAVFEMPSDADSGNNIFIPSGTNINSVLFSCWLVYIEDNEQKTKGMSLVAFAIEPTTLSVEHDQNINVAQWNELVNLITGESQFDSINVNEVNFRPTNNPSETGLSMKDNVIYWQGTPIATFNDVVLLSGNQNINGIKTFNGVTNFNDVTSFYDKIRAYDSIVITDSGIVIRTDDVTHNIITSDVPEEEQTFNVALPNDSGTLLTNNTGVDLENAQTIGGAKEFTEELEIGDKLTINGGTDGDVSIKIDNTNPEGTGKHVTHNIKTKSGANNDDVFNHNLPNTSGDLLDVNNGVTIADNQTITGKKQFNDETTFEEDIKINNQAVVIFNEAASSDILITAKISTKNTNIKLPTTQSGNVDITLPNVSGDLVTNNNGNFKEQIKLEDAEIGGTAIQIKSTAEGSGNVLTHNIKTQSTGASNDYNVVLPNNSGMLLTENTGVKIDGDQNITGKKKFDNLNVAISGGITDDGSLGYNVTGKKYLGRVNGVQKEILTEDALTPTILPTATSATLPNIPGGTTNVPIVNFQGTYTVPVIPGYTIDAATTDTTAVLNINQDTGVISIDLASGNNIELSWHYETTRKGFYFTIGSDYNGVYVFTFNYLMMLVPIYGLTEKKIYKFAGPGIQDFTTGSVINMLYNMLRVGNYLYIWSGRSEYQIASGVTGTLIKVKLY